MSIIDDYFGLNPNDLFSRASTNSNINGVALTASAINKLRDQLAKHQYTPMMRMQMDALRYGFGSQSFASLYFGQPEPIKDDTPKSDIKLPDNILPGDGKMIGYLEGYRAWRFNIKEARLRSDNFDEVVWQPKIPIKATFQGKTQVGKGAGIYASKDRELIEKDYDPKKITDPLAYLSSKTDKPYVIGKIALWGAIKEHKNGYRAEYAYPLEFLKATNVAPELEFVLLRALSEIYLPRKR